MFKRRWKDAVRERLDSIYNLVQRIEAALVVRDPGTQRSVEAYEGLRKTVVGAMRARRQHLTQLVTVSEAIDRGATVETLKARLEEWCVQAGLRRWYEPEPAEFFDVIEGDGPFLEVLTGAWVDDSGEVPVLIKAGTARRVRGAVEGGRHSRDGGGHDEMDSTVSSSAAVDGEPTTGSRKDMSGETHGKGLE